MPEQTTYGPPAGEGQRDEALAIVGRCFFPTAAQPRASEFADSVGAENLRVLQAGDRTVATLGLVPMALWFGGRTVPTAGVAAVGVDPEHRGSGFAKALMRRTLEEIHETGLPLSALYASTYGLYRSVGYERAGSRFLARLRPPELRSSGGGARELEVRPIEAADREAVLDLQRRWARMHPGHLERAPHNWNRVTAPQGLCSQGYLVLREGRPEGYVYWTQVPAKGHSAYELAVHDLAALSPEAARRLLTLFADHGSLATAVSWPSSPTDPVLLALPERFFGLTLQDQWLIRIVDAPAALAARGYPPGIEAELHLAVRDELLLSLIHI